MTTRNVTAAVLLLVLTGCDQHATSGPGFTEEIVPLLKRHCVMCHMDGGALGDLSLHPQPYQAIVGVKSTQADMLLIKPGDVEASYFYHKLSGTHLEAGGSGDRMPYQRARLTAEELKLVEQWIAQGAENN